MTTYIYNCQNYTSSHAEDVGGKANNLFKLARNDINVPEFICISSRAFQDTLVDKLDEIRSCLDRCDFTDYTSLKNTSDDIKHIILGCSINESILSQLQKSLVEMGNVGAFSVRSSACYEDGMKHSFAGQLRTWLNVPKDDVISKIKSCWLSAFEPGVLTYTHKINQDPLQNYVAVIVQKMVNAERSGVLFQADPRGGWHKLVITAGYGLGEGIVADKVESDLYEYDKFTQQWKLEINDKFHAIKNDANTGTRSSSVDKTLSTQAVLNDQHRRSLLLQSNKIAELCTHFQDIEWSIDSQDQLYILQTRAITTIPEGVDRVYDSSNIMESYPGIIQPMTFSVLHTDYYNCMKHALMEMGASISAINKHEAVLYDLVGYINGRAYYNISNWYRVLLLVPFAKKRIRNYFEQMIGSEGSYSKELDHLKLNWREKITTTIGFTYKLFYNFLRHDSLIRNYFEKSNQIFEEISHDSVSTTSADLLISYLNKYTKEFTKILSVPIINDFYSMIFMALCREQLQRLGVKDARDSLNRYLAHQEIESTLPLQSARKLSVVIAHSLHLQKVLVDLLKNRHLNTMEGVNTFLRAHRLEEFADQFEVHIRKYAYRCPKELVMESNTYREDPFEFVRMILAMSKNRSCDTPHTNRDMVPSDEVVSASHSRIFRWLLKKTRQYIAVRESTRLDRGKIFAQFRIMLLQLGRQLVSESVLDNARDVFLFTLPELNAYRKARSPNTDLRGLALYRKNTIETWHKSDPQERIFTRGVVFANKIPDRITEKSPNDNVLHGIACSPGKVCAEARIISNPGLADDVTDKILVSMTTDPGWVFIMTQSKGLISERGSVLSHTAIIGRELGIPTIVGVKQVTRILKEGDTVCMDGATGDIEFGAHLLRSKSRNDVADIELDKTTYTAPNESC